MSTPVTITIHEGVAAIDAVDWDRCADPDGAHENPFLSHRFLSALEESGSVGGRTGWTPRPIVATRGGAVIGVAPLYIKHHSQGEYVFDHSWAHAFERAGGSYYPKALIAVPFTPATGRRLLAAQGHEAEATAALAQGAVQVAAEHDLSSLHITFCTEAEAIAGEALGLMRRTSQQYHWENPGYRGFEDFLAALSSRKRKAIRRERTEAQDFGGEIVQLRGDAIKPHHWDAFWHFYQDTGSRKWGTPYLTRNFFELIGASMADDLLLVLALREGQPVAGALNFIGSKTLYGRYWGCLEHHPFLHFELCYYQAIDFAIAHCLRVEAGAQGEHKLARGYMPAETHSLHLIGHPDFREAVAQFLSKERRAVDHEIEVLTSYGPFRRGEVPEQD
jgi:predicted N-acyltransferase